MCHQEVRCAMKFQADRTYLWLSRQLDLLPHLVTGEVGGDVLTSDTGGYYTYFVGPLTEEEFDYARNAIEDIRDVIADWKRHRVTKMEWIEDAGFWADRIHEIVEAMPG